MTKMINLVLGLALVGAVACQNSNAKDKSEQKKQKVEMQKLVNLKAQLEAKTAKFNSSASKEVISLHANGIKKVVDSGIVEKALKVGDKAPNFTLKNQLGKEVNLYDVLKEEVVVLTWYRGGWCPYCNLTLHALQAALPQIQAENAKLLALTPELPDKSLSTAEKHELKFQVLSDVHNKVGKSFGVVFELEQEVAKAYQKGFDLHAFNGDNSNELPMAATYIIGKDGVIKWAFVNADYKKRAEPAMIVEQLKKLK